MILNKDLTPSQSEIDKLIGFYQNRKYEDAEKLVKTIIEKNPRHTFSLKLLAEILRLTGRVSQSLAVVQKVLLLDPQDAAAHSNLGNIFKELNRLSEAKASYQKAININPSFAEAYSNLGTILESDGDLEEAEINYLKALDLKPNFAETHNNLAVLQRKNNQLIAAEASFKKAIDLKPDFIQAYSNLASLQSVLKNLKEAEISYQKVIELNPNSAEPFNNLGTIQLNLGNLKEAEINFQKATILDTDYAEAFKNLGEVKREFGKTKEAIQYLLKALELQIDYPEANYVLGKILFVNKNYTEAEKQFNIAKNYDDSGNYLLRSLYLLNKKDDFNNQLDSMLNEGKVNAVIGSLISRSDIKYSTNKKNVFCKDPMKYILETDLNKQCDFNKIFIEAAQNILDDETISFRSQGLLNNGQQSAGNLFNLKSEAIKKIQETLQLEVERYRYHFKDSNEGLLINWPKNYNLYGWLISMKSGGSLDSHMHDGGWLSGSVYINVPPKSKTDSGNLVLNIDYLKSHPNYEPPLSNKNLFSFLSNKNKIKEVTNQEKIIDVVTGSLCLFPSSLLHHTIPFESKEDRIVLAFDVRPK